MASKDPNRFDSIIEKIKSTIDMTKMYDLEAIQIKKKEKSSKSKKLR